MKEFKSISGLQMGVSYGTTFRLSSMKRGSDHYGPCEVCRQHVSEFFKLTPQRG